MVSLTDTKKAFLEHLSELRKVLIYCVISLLACFIIIFVLFCDELMDFVLAPIRQFGCRLYDIGGSVAYRNEGLLHCWFYRSFSGHLLLLLALFTSGVISE